MKEISSPAEISTEHKYLRLILKLHSPKEVAGFMHEPAEVFVSYIPRQCHHKVKYKTIAALRGTFYLAKIFSWTS